MHTYTYVRTYIHTVHTVHKLSSVHTNIQRYNIKDNTTKSIQAHINVILNNIGSNLMYVCMYVCMYVQNKTTEHSFDLKT